jgi:hypothetical protein
VLAGSRLKMLEGAPMVNEASVTLMPKVACTNFILSMLEFSWEWGAVNCNCERKDVFVDMLS